VTRNVLDRICIARDRQLTIRWDDGVEGNYGALWLRDPHFIYHVQLSNGDLGAFDNRRTLHGQKASSIGAGPSHLQGCFTATDAPLGGLAVLER